MSKAEFNGSWLRDSLPEIEMAREMWDASPDGQAHRARVQEWLDSLPDAKIELQFGPNPLRAAVEAWVAEHGQAPDPLVHIGYGPDFRHCADGTIVLWSPARGARVGRRFLRCGFARYGCPAVRPLSAVVG